MLWSLPPGKETFTIGEVTALTGVPPHRLRYWERRVGVLRPIRRASGHRRFSRQDLEAIAHIESLVEKKGMTLKGAKKELRLWAKRGPVQPALEFGESSAAVETLMDLKREIGDLLHDLRKGS